MNFDNISLETLNAIDLVESSKLIKSKDSAVYFVDIASKEHYRLLSYLSISEDNISFLDVGSYKGCSALAMSINKKNKVYSFDVSSSVDLSEIPENIKFYTADILEPSHIELILNSNYILLDTFHDGVFENQFYNHLIQINYKGVLLLDDIYLNEQMNYFWNSINKPKKDLTHIGHATGTGIVHF